LHFKSEPAYYHRPASQAFCHFLQQGFNKTPYRWANLLTTIGTSGMSASLAVAGDSTGTGIRRSLWQSQESDFTVVNTGEEGCPD